MRLDKFICSIFIQLKPEWADLVEKEGRLTVELDKALYACVMSSTLWYEFVPDKFHALGYQELAG